MVASLASMFSDRSIWPIHVVGLQARKMRLRRAQVPCNVRGHADRFTGESACRPDKGENGGFDWRGKFSPSRDYLRQFGTGRD